MKGFFGLGQLSANEKSDILNQHKSVYNGYQTMQPQVSNTQPLTVYDFAGDKEGMVVNNKGEVKKYTNMGINEQHEMSEEKQMCSECGVGYVEEGMCNECGYGNVEENWTDDTEMCECGGEMYEGECNECGWKSEMEEGYKTGHLDDIYDEEDLNPSAGFDYIEGPSNDVDTFEGMHKKLYEQGGNADDEDVSDVESAYDFVSGGPMNSGVNPISEVDFDDLLDADEDLEIKRDELDEKEYEEMESAWNEEIDEIDISGVQGVYGDMEPAYDFDSDGPGKAGPYQTRESTEGETDEQYPRKHKWRKMVRKQAALDKGEDFDDSELDISDYEDEYNPESSSWEEITQMTGDDEFSNVDEDIRESLVIQKNKVMEMMTRMKVI